MRAWHWPLARPHHVQAGLAGVGSMSWLQCIDAICTNHVDAPLREQSRARRIVDCVGEHTQAGRANLADESLVEITMARVQ